MRFGTDPNQVAVVQWQFCQPGAKPLGFPTPFISRRRDSDYIYPDIGEVMFSPTLNTPTIPTSLAPGTAEPCGDPAVWANGYQGHVPPNYPRNVFGLAMCCGAFMGAVRLKVRAYLPTEVFGYFPDDYFGPDYFGDDYFR